MVLTFLLYCILVLSTSGEEMSSYTVPKGEFNGDSSAEDAKRYFQEKLGNAINQKVCQTGRPEEDIACLVYACQAECDSSGDCMKTCLSLDECTSRSSKASSFIDCVRRLRGVGFWAANRYYIIGIAILCVVISVVLACCCICRMEDKAFNAALKKNPHPTATEGTANNPEVSLQVAPKMVVQSPERNSSATSVGPATAKAPNNPQISAA